MLIIVAVTMMLLSERLVLASTIEVPTLDTSNFISNGTRTIDYTDKTTLEVPYKNSTRTIDIEEYRQCIINSNQRVIKSVNDAGLNTPEYTKNIKNLQTLGMEGLHYLQ